MIINSEETTIESLAKTLAEKGIRPSYQRIKVLEYLYQKGGHPTVDDIFCNLSPEIPSLSKVTVYNTLHTFIDSGLVRCVDIDGSEMCYDITLTNHGHFMCDGCGKIFNFEVDFDRIPVEQLEKFAIKEMNLYFKGLCPNCIKTTPHLEKEKNDK